MDKEGCLFVILVKFWTIFFTIIGIVILIKECTNTTDPMDNSITAIRRCVGDIYVKDEEGNGFNLIYRTTNPVTEKRWNEICSRKHIKEGYDKLKTEAPLHFGNMLETDIYDFALYAREFEIDKDITIERIFIDGREKISLYEHPHPNIENCATKISSITLQGVQFINHDDIYFHKSGGRKTYRYWKCNSIYSRPSTDERYIHFSEKERIK